MIDQFESKPLMHCPHCQTVLQIHLTCKGVIPVELRPQAESIPSAPVRSPDEQVFLEAAHRAGLIEPFRQVVEMVKTGDGIPKDIEVFFLQFVRTLVRRLIPSYAMRAFNQLYHHRPLEYYTSQAIGVVVVDGYMRLFVPNTDVLGTRIRHLNHTAGRGPRTLKVNDGEAKLAEWIRTRYGYVEGPGALYDQLRQRSFGSFAQPSLSGPD